MSACSLHTLKNEEVLISGLDVPEGWNQYKGRNIIKSPEGDLKIHFFKFNKDESFDLIKKSSSLWRRVNSKFNYSIKNKVSPPHLEGWDKITQISYDIPVEKSKIAITLMREKVGLVYLNLIESSIATMEKRSPQMSVIIDSWKPSGFMEKDYSFVKAKKIDQGFIEKFDQFLLELKKDLNIPGFAIGIIQDGKNVYKKGFAVTKISNGTKIDSDTLFMIGSTTKPLTTLLMAQLVTEGKMDWDAKVSTFLKGWSLKDKKFSKSLSMEHTACACTGMPRRDFDIIFESTGITPEKRLEQMKEMAPTTKPGETFQYSNSLVAVGGYAAARAYRPDINLQSAYKKAIEDLVFKPLKMQKSLVINNVPYMKKSAYPHVLNLSYNSELLSPKIEESVDSVAPAGAIWSNIDDMIKYLKYELSEGDLLPGYILKSELLRRRKRNVKILNNLYYGLGLFIEDHKGIKVFHHGGNTFGFTSDMFFIPSKGIGAVVLVNQGNADKFRSLVKKKLMELLFGIKANISKEIAFYRKEFKKSVKKLNKKLTSFIEDEANLLGTYKSVSLGQMSIFKKTGSLIADFGEFESVLKEKNDSGKNRVFVLMSPPWFGAMEFIYDGKTFLLDGGQKKYYFSKVKK